MIRLVTHLTDYPSAMRADSVTRWNKLFGASLVVAMASVFAVAEPAESATSPARQLAAAATISARTLAASLSVRPEGGSTTYARTAFSALDRRQRRLPGHARRGLARRVPGGADIHDQPALCRVAGPLGVALRRRHVDASRRR